MDEIDIEKQEEIVAVLWDFAQNLQTKTHNARNSEGVSVNTDAVGEALDRIMVLFGYTVVPID